jgi:hypothetical protein
MTDVPIPESERTKTNRLLKNLESLEQFKKDNQSPEELVQIEILISLRKMEFYLSNITGFELE